MSKIEIADIVKHHPTGEEWVVARVTETDVYPAGWPPSCAELRDCELVEKATPEQREKMIEDCRRLPRSDSRHIKTCEPLLKTFQQEKNHESSI